MKRESKQEVGGIKFIGDELDNVENDKGGRHIHCRPRGYRYHVLKEAFHQ